MMEQKQRVVNRLVRPPASGPPVASVTLTPKEVLGILRRHLWLVILMTVAGIIAGGAAWYLLLRYLPKYRAYTYLEVLSPVDTDPMLITAPFVQKDIQYSYRSSIAALINQQSSLQNLLGLDTIQDTEWFKQFAKYDEQGKIANRDRCIKKAFEDLEDNFRAYPERDREFVSLSMTCGSRKESAQIVNEMMNLFIVKHGRTEKGEITTKLANLQSQHDKVQANLRAAEEALKDVRDATKLTDLEQIGGRFFQHTITLKLNNLEIERDRLFLQIRQMQAAIGELTELATGPVGVQIEHQIETDPVLVALAQQLALQESVLAGRLSKFGDNHREVRQIKQFIEEVRQERQTRKAMLGDQVRQAQVRNARDQLVVMQEQMKELQRMRQEAEAKQGELDAARIQYAQRLKIRDERQLMLDAIKGNIQKLQIMHDAPETPKVRAVGLAEQPLTVSSPRWEFYFPGGTMLGLIFGVGLAFLIELLNDLVRTPRDVGRYLHIPLLGVIPDAAEDAQVRDVDMYHVVRQAPYSIISESYRRFRTNLRLSGSADGNRVLLVTSAMPADGKSSVAVNLSATLVAQNKKVLLIDANFRRPKLQMLFPKAEQADSEVARSESGLSSLLTGMCSYDDARRTGVIDGLDIIESGPLPPNPAELLSSYRMEQLVADLRKSYDYIIIDTSPLLLVSDAKVLARIVDGTILVFSAETTRRGVAQRTIRELKEVNATIVGCVLFAVRAMKGGYFREQYKTYRQYQGLQLAHSH